MLDIGANIGNHAIFLRNHFSQIHCFDPNPIAVERLAANIDLNGESERIVVHPVGLGDENRDLYFHVERGSNLGASHFVDLPDTKSMLLPIRNGDKYLASKNLSEIAFIKIDVEEYEFAVVKGLEETLRTWAPILAFEHHGKKVGPEIFKFLGGLGYRFFEPTYAPYDAGIFAKLAFGLTNAGMPELREIVEPDNRTYENVVAFAKPISGH